MHKCSRRIGTLEYFMWLSIEFEDGSDMDRNFKSCWKKKTKKKTRNIKLSVWHQAANLYLAFVYDKNRLKSCNAPCTHLSSQKVWIFKGFGNNLAGEKKKNLFWCITLLSSLSLSSI